MVAGDYTILTWNVNGLGNRIKRGLVSNYLKRFKPVFVLLQETHLLGPRCAFLGRGQYTTLAHAGFTCGLRGVVILVRKSPPFTVTRKWEDAEGTYVAVQGVWNHTPWLLVSVYAPRVSNSAHWIR